MKLSIIIPYYNVRKKLLSECLHSICSQINNECEVIIIDDGSDEFPHELLNKYAHIRYNYQDNQGVSVARNRGIEIATGEYVMFVDPDDLVADGAIRNILSFLNHEENRDVEIALSYFGTINEERKNIPLIVNDVSIPDKYIVINDVLRHTESISGISLGAVWTKVFKRLFLVKNKLLFTPNLKKCQDRLFMLYCYEKSQKIKIIPFCTYLYREDNQLSICNRYNSNIDEILNFALSEVEEFITSYYALDTKIKNSFYEMKVIFFIETLKLKYLNDMYAEKNILKTTKIINEFLHINNIYNAIDYIDFSNCSINRKIFLIILKLHMTIVFPLCKKYIKL